MVSISIPEEYLSKPKGYSEKELKIDLAVLLYRRKMMSLAKAARWCGLSRLEFQQFLDDQNVEIHYSVAEFDKDMATLNQLFGQ